MARTSKLSYFGSLDFLLVILFQRNDFNPTNLGLFGNLTGFALNGMEEHEDVVKIGPMDTHK